MEVKQEVTFNVQVCRDVLPRIEDRNVLECLGGMVTESSEGALLCSFNGVIVFCASTVS